MGVAHTHGDAVAWLPEEKILQEMTGEKFPAKRQTGDEARLWHAHQHGLLQKES